MDINTNISIDENKINVDCNNNYNDNLEYLFDDIKEVENFDINFEEQYVECSVADLEHMDESQMLKMIEQLCNDSMITAEKFQNLYSCSSDTVHLLTQDILLLKYHQKELQDLTS